MATIVLGVPIELGNAVRRGWVCSMTQDSVTGVYTLTAQRGANTFTVDGANIWEVCSGILPQLEPLTVRDVYNTDPPPA